MFTQNQQTESTARESHRFYVDVRFSFLRVCALHVESFWLSPLVKLRGTAPYPFLVSSKFEWSS